MRRSPTPFESLRRDRAVMDEIHSEAASRRKFPREEHLSGGKKAIVQYIENPLVHPGKPLESHDRLPEAIILAEGRPSLIVQNGTFETPHNSIWEERLAPHRKTIEGILPSVGRVEVVGHPDFEWLGTAWVVDERTLVTNRHVAALFARRQGRGFALIHNPFGDPVGANVDFREEHQIRETFEVNVEEVLFIADQGPRHPDMAVLRLSAHDDLPDPIPLSSKDPEVGEMIGVVGYPAFDTRNSGILLSQIFHEIFDVKRLAPGFVTFAENGLDFEHDCTTLGGNSGSVAFNVETGEAVGLHFAGRFGVANFAVKASVVKQTLAGVRSPTHSFLSSADEERRMTVDDYEGREGYSEKFLGSGASLHVPLPELSPSQLDDAVYVEGAHGRGLSRYVLDYTHFSVVMCKSRRLAYFTAVNIDGTQEVLLRRQRTSWVFDARIPERFQAGNDLYRHNDADRGHLVRRLDPVWGSNEIARQADADSFHYTNAAPQHKNLNQRTWLSLEDHLLSNAGERDLKINVFTGPVFRECDVEYRGVQIPEEFWKVVSMVGPNGDLHATAYLLSQRELIDDFEFVFGPFRTFQTSVRNIEKKTGLNFGRLSAFDPMDGAESRQGVIPLSSLEQIIY